MISGFFIPCVELTMILNFSKIVYIEAFNGDGIGALRIYVRLHLSRRDQYED